MIVFMFHFGRSGSTVLTNCINQSPEIFWQGEIFSDNIYISPEFENSSWFEKQGGAACFTLDEFIDYIKFCISESKYKEDGAKHYGCEIKSYHFEFGRFQFSLVECLNKLREEFSAEFIFLERTNSLRRILSSLLGAQKNIWHLHEESVTPNKITIDVNDFHDADLNFRGHIATVCDNSKKKNAEYRNAILSMQGQYIEYESDIDNSSLVGFYKLVEFIGVDSFQPIIKFKKTNPQPLSEIIINYEEVLPFLTSSN